MFLKIFAKSSFPLGGISNDKRQEEKQGVQETKKLNKTTYSKSLQISINDSVRRLCSNRSSICQCLQKCRMLCRSALYLGDYSAALNVSLGFTHNSVSCLNFQSDFNLLLPTHPQGMLQFS